MKRTSISGVIIGGSGGLLKKIATSVGIILSGSVLAAICLSLSSASLCYGGERGPEFYRKEMIGLISGLHRYAEERHPGFGILPNGGVSIYLPEDDGMAYDLGPLLGSIDGVLVESVFYGGSLEDGGKTPEETTAYFQRALSLPKSRGIPVFNIDYCSDPAVQRASEEKNRLAGYVDFQAPSRNLDMFPRTGVPDGNTEDCRKLKDVRNFLVLLNPSRYGTRENFLKRLRETDYDLLIIDLYFGDRPWTPEEIATLGTKKDGGKRLVYAYMSIGEAEDYRKYWNPEWEARRPDWLAESNEEWEGSYKVRYWRKEWKDILCGSSDAYLDRILRAGFDGAFLDVVDTFYYFEEMEK